MHEVKDLRVSDARKRREIFERNTLLVEEKMRKSQAAVERKVREKEKHTVSIINWCLWQTEAQVEVEVVQLTKKKDKEAALKSQLCFQELVFKQQAKKHLFAASKKDVVRGGISLWRS